MAAKKLNVVFEKRVEDREKGTGEKIVIAAGTKAQLTEAEYKRVKHAVRVIKDEAGKQAGPELDSGTGGDEDTGDGITGD